MPLIYNFFGGDPHRVIELNDEIVSHVDHVPTMLGDMGIFTVDNPLTRDVAVGSEQDGMVLIPFSADGEPPHELSPTQKNYKLFRTERLAKGSTVYARELAALVNMTGDQQMASVERRIARESSRIIARHDATKENMRLGAVQGYLLDHDGTPKEDFFDVWGVTRPAAISYNLSDTNADVRKSSRDLQRTIQAAIKTPWTAGMSIGVLCSSTFFEDLIGHNDVKETYLNQQAANDLREVEAYDMLTLGNVTYYDFRGGEGGADVIQIADGEAKAFPVGVPDAFMEYNGPADEFRDFLNEEGRPYYAMVLTDPSGRGSWDRIEGYSYPLMLPTRVGSLQTLSAA